MNATELKLVLDNHKKWLDNINGGKQANLRGADLSMADLSRADLSDRKRDRKSVV